MLTPIARDHAVSRSEFEALLRAWSQSAADAEWIGDEAGRGQQAWVHVRHDGRVFALNADTQCVGVREYLRLVSADANLEWSVVANRHGRRNKVAFGPGRATVTCFYLYVLGDGGA